MLISQLHEPSASAAQLAAPPAGDDVLAAIAMDLHDLALQRLFAASLSLERLQHHIPAGASSDRFHTVLADLDTTIAQLRSLIAAAKRQPRRDPQLQHAIEEVVALATPSLGFRPRVRIRGLEHHGVPADIARDVTAVLSEALSNVTRHATATAVHVYVTANFGELRVEVSDNGRGVGRLQRRGGLANLATRAARHSGTFELLSRPRGGTVLTWTAPLR